MNSATQEDLLSRAAPKMLEMLREIAVIALPKKRRGTPSPLSDEQRRRIADCCREGIGKAMGIS